MKLIIDIGNTRLKAALFNGNELEHLFIFNSQNEFIASDIFKNHRINHCLLASVVTEVDNLIQYLMQHKQLIIFTKETETPLKNLYESVNSLGSDRLAAAVGANFLFPNKNCLVIDAGTCMKYNFVNDKNEFIGGSISPGLQMRFKALNHYTSRLPLIDKNENFNSIIGKTTEESILSGVQTGVMAEVEGIICFYSTNYFDLNVILTGGDVNFFEKQFKNHIFAAQNSPLLKLMNSILFEQHLVLIGLNTILDFNINEK